MLFVQHLLCHVDNVQLHIFFRQHPDSYTFLNVSYINKNNSLDKISMYFMCQFKCVLLSRGI